MRNKRNFNIVLAIVLIISLAFAVPVLALASNELTIERYYEQPYSEKVTYIDFYDLDIINVLDMYEMYLIEKDEVFFAEYLEIQRIMEMQAPAVEAYGVLMEYFMDYYGNLIFPDNYAGSYLRDHQTLVIQLTDINRETIAFYTNLLGSDAPITFQEVNFSLNQLIAFGEMFVEAIDAPVVSHGFDIMNNTYSIALYKNSIEAVEVVNNFNNSITTFNDSISFFTIPITLELEGIAETNLLRGGYQLIGESSIGITGYRAGVQSLISAGHVFIGATEDTRIVRSGVHIGNVHSFRFGNLSLNAAGRPNGDWAIITLNANGRNMMTNQVRNGLQIGGTTAPLTNSTVTGSGFRTLRFSGTVNATGRTVTLEYAPNRTQNVPGMVVVRANANSAFPVRGDSGGPIWHQLANGTNAITGIHAGGNSVTRYFFFSPVSAAPFAPRVTP